MLLCKDILSTDQPSLWVVATFVNHIWAELVEWKVGWVPRICNELAHNLAKWATQFGEEGFFSEGNVLEHIRSCDMHGLF